MIGAPRASYTRSPMAKILLTEPALASMAALLAERLPAGVEVVGAHELRRRRASATRGRCDGPRQLPPADRCHGVGDCPHRPLHPARRGRHQHRRSDGGGGRWRDGRLQPRCQYAGRRRACCDAHARPDQAPPHERTADARRDVRARRRHQQGRRRPRRGRGRHRRHGQHRPRGDGTLDVPSAPGSSTDPGGR